MVDSSDDENPANFVPARHKQGTLDERINEASDQIARDFNAAVARQMRKVRENPRKNPAELYYEEPFHSDAIAEYKRLKEERQRQFDSQELEHDFLVRGRIPVVTLEEEERMQRNIARRKAKEEAYKARMAAWNVDQPTGSPSAHSLPPAQPSSSARQDPAPKNRTVESNSTDRQANPGRQNAPVQSNSQTRQATPAPQSVPVVPNSPAAQGGCSECKGACVLDSRRSIMSCSNEPMLPSLMTDLLAQFYRMGWMMGSGGAMAAISCDNRLLLSPSSLQKERIKPCDLFASSPNSREVKAPPCMPNGKATACEGVFKLIMEKTGAQCVIHSHSKAANIASRIIRTTEWGMSGQEYIKGIYNYRTGQQMVNEDILVVPIIENRPTEQDLEPLVEAVLNNTSFTQCTAILVRSHGVFVWGPTWQKTKIMAEIYEYLFDLSADMLKLGIPLIRAEDLTRAMSNGFFGPLPLAPLPNPLPMPQPPVLHPHVPPPEPSVPSAPPM